MKSKIIKIGNSQGIRIPKMLIEQTGLMGEVEIEVDNNRLVIGPVVRPRAEWEEAFKKMAERGDDELIDGDVVIPTAEEDKWE